MAKETKNPKAVVEAKKVVADLLGFLEVDADVEIALTTGDDERETLIIAVTGGDALGRLIGRRGRSLNSLQIVLGMLINRNLKEEERVFVVVDVNGYRDKRKESLESMAKKASDIARKSGRPYEMPPMGAAERRIIHMFLSEDGEVETESTGEGRDRRVIVTPSESVPPDSLDDGQDEGESEIDIDGSDNLSLDAYEDLDDGDEKEPEEPTKE